jgi:tetratricopeptide (TPR) repeat protein
MVSDFRDPEDRLERAISRFDRGEVGAARAELHSLLRMGYRSVEVYLYLGHCGLEAQNLRAALRRYRQAHRAARRHPAVCLGRAIVAARRLRFPRAVTLFRRALALDPSLQEAHDNLILCFAALGQLESAEAAFRASVHIDPLAPRSYFNAACLYFERGDAARARSLWLHVLELAPGWLDAERMVANCERLLGDPEAARRRLERLRRRHPRNADLRSDLGLCHEARDEWQSAVEAYRAALEVDAGRAAVRARLGWLLFLHDRRPEGLEHLERAGADGPGDAEVLDPLTEALRREGRPEAAAAALRRALRAHPGDPDLRAVRARHSLELRRPLRAAADYRRALRRTHDSLELRCGLAYALAEAGRVVPAERILEQAAAGESDRPEPHLLRADLALRRGDLVDCARVLEEAVRRLPDDLGLLLRLAEVYLRSGRAAEALDLARGLQDRRGSESLGVMGEAYLALGDHSRARRIAERLLQLDPEDARGLFLRARTRLARGQAEPAAADFRAYVRLQPADPHGYRGLARCLTALGQDRAARAQRRIAALVQHPLEARGGKTAAAQRTQRD